MNSLSWANLSVGGLKLIDISRVSSRTPEYLQVYDFYDFYVQTTGQNTVQNCPDPLENSALCKARGPTTTKGRCPSSTGQVGVAYFARPSALSYWPPCGTWARANLSHSVCLLANASEVCCGKLTIICASLILRTGPARFRTQSKDKLSVDFSLELRTIERQFGYLGKGP